MADDKLGGLAGHRGRRRRRLDGRAFGQAPGTGRRRAIHVVNRSLPGPPDWRTASVSRAWRPTRPLDHIATVLGDADVVVSCTGAVRPVVSLADAHRGLMGRSEKEQLVICDLGMPRDVDPAVAGLPGVFVVDMDRIQRGTVGAPRLRRRRRPRDRRRRSCQLPGRTADGRGHPDRHRAPAGRRRGRGRVAAAGQPAAGLDAAHRDEVAKTVRRVVDKLLHAPTVRVKQLASAPGGDSYAEALRELSNSTSMPSTPSPGPNCLVAPISTKPSNA